MALPLAASCASAGEFSGVAFFAANFGEGFFAEETSAGSLTSSAGFSTGAAFLDLDAAFGFGGMLTAVKGLLASAFFAAGFALGFEVAVLVAGFGVELVDRGLSPGRIAGYGSARAPDVRRSALGILGDCCWSLVLQLS